MTLGQEQALAELREVEDAAASYALEIVDVSLPTGSSDSLVVEISLHTGNLPRANAGLPLRARERLKIYIPAKFPFAVPRVLSVHRRFGGRPHVHWGSLLCTYQSPQTEWNPADGMFGFLERLHLWLSRGALDELDAPDQPLHPPVTYQPKAGHFALVIPKVNTPPVTTIPWVGLAQIVRRNSFRVDIIDWMEIGSARNGESAAVVLLAEPMPWEFPANVADLLAHCAVRGVDGLSMMGPLMLAAIRAGTDQGIYFILGAPMRGLRGAAPTQHLTAWHLPAVAVASLRLATEQFSDVEALRQIGARGEQIFRDWASLAPIEWCHMLEDRPEIVVRRDYAAPSTFFARRTVALWGCGALGGAVATFLVQAGVRRIILHDKGLVTPGLLVRQLYDEADVGKPKSDALRERLLRMRPDVEIEARTDDLLTLLENVEADWSDGADVVIDCTASGWVQGRLEIARSYNEILTRAAPAPVVSMIIDRRAERGLVVLARPSHSGGVADVYRRVKIEACKKPSLRDFADAFYPQGQQTDLFQPEPGCSEPTFVGSAADASALAAAMFNLAAVDLSTSVGNLSTAHAHFIIQSHVIPPKQSGQKAKATFRFRADRILRSTHGGYEVRIAPQALRTMYKWHQRSRHRAGRRCETGGILLGQRDAALRILWVSEASGPPPGSHASPDLFVCGTEGTLVLHEERVGQTRGAINYIGLWHTHPESPPSPSGVDLGAMCQLFNTGELSPSLTLLLILGMGTKPPRVGAYVFSRRDFKNMRPFRLRVRQRKSRSL